MSSELLNNFRLKEILEKEIDLIQACIERMSQHSFQLKGWLITLIGVLLTLGKKEIILVNIFLILISVAFWYLNAVYLRYEKQYRELYTWVIKERVNGNEEFLYDLDISRFNNIESRKSLMFKNTLKVFYGSVTIALIILLIILLLRENWIHIVRFLKLIICNINV